MPVKIALRYLDGRDKVALLNQVLDVAGLEAELEAMRKSLRKERGNLKIAIKPNASMFARPIGVDTASRQAVRPRSGSTSAPPFNLSK